VSKNNGVKQRESVTKDEITDIIMHLDEHFKTDAGWAMPNENPDAQHTKEKEDE